MCLLKGVLRKWRRRARAGTLSLIFPGAPEAPATTAHHAKGRVFPERTRTGAVFRVEKRIGCGGMAEVFLSRDLVLHGPAAVKVLREGNTDARRRFADEGRLLANLPSEDGAPCMALVVPGRAGARSGRGHPPQGAARSPTERSRAVLRARRLRPAGDARKTGRRATRQLNGWSAHNLAGKFAGENYRSS